MKDFDENLSTGVPAGDRRHPSCSRRVRVPGRIRCSDPVTPTSTAADRDIVERNGCSDTSARTMATPLTPHRPPEAALATMGLVRLEPGGRICLKELMPCPVEYSVGITSTGACLTVGPVGGGTITARVDSRGRLSIPRAAWERCGLAPGDRVAVLLASDGRLVLAPCPPLHLPDV